MKRILALIPIITICLATDPDVPSPRAAVIGAARSKAIPTPAEFEALAASDPVAALEASLARFERDVQGYQCLLFKQESTGSKAGPVELIRLSVREEPFAVCLVWEQGAGSAKASLYVSGRDGLMRVRTSFGILALDPGMGKGTARYSIEEAGLHHGTLRTHAAWKAARDRGQLITEYRGRKAIAELGGRECLVIHRTVTPPEVDSFRMNDGPKRDAAKYPKEAFAGITIYLDCETWQQRGSELWKPDGTRLAAYFFKDVIINPKFTTGQFKDEALGR